jgi:hypothetical protein
MNEKEKPRIKYEKPEAQRLTDTKAHGACYSGSSDADDCVVGKGAYGCATGNGPGS